MQQANKKFCKQSIALYANQYLGIREKYIEIPIVDNKELRENLIARIEAVTLKIIEQISAEQAPRISYFNGQNIISKLSTHEENVYPESSSSSNSNSQLVQQETMFFKDTLTEEQDADNRDIPQKSEKTIIDFTMRSRRNKFVLIVVILAEIHYLLIRNITKTRRSFYYNLKSEATKLYLVPSQRYIDRALNDIANLLGCAPWDLGLLATAKGLMAGNMTITLVGNQVIDCTISGGVQIPQNSNITSIRAKAEFVLVIEKDAIFQKLLEENCSRALRCILVTGKGYPDVATRMLVKMLSEKMDLPVYILVDADPFGVDIMLTYRFGSSTLCKENESLACPNARWLGIHPSELNSLTGVKTIPLTEADLVKLRSIEARSYVNAAISKELSILRKGKAEIEAMSSSKDFLTHTYLFSKINDRDYI
ncbi:PREDICTED: meiotic recombination protein SPO11 [Wasmannia auropunctata]|uniref:meiotic recombination protein SPO11 n=1 Tax=Wasmannia auropunctata TaxID=64793 RepID=UPI0005EF5381|nr:PREDICTED: meiotic recombination protein SPO11 [Wasmannia auropunctata]